MDPGRRVQLALFAGYRRMPSTLRGLLVRAFTPSFHVGAICVVERADGHLLLVRQSYRREGWGFPGGLLRRNEDPADAARRELREELGIDVLLQGLPVVVVDSPMRRVDVIFNAKVAEGSGEPEHTPHSPEIADARWFPPHGLPSLLPEATAAMIQLGRTFGPSDRGGR